MGSWYMNFSDYMGGRCLWKFNSMGGGVKIKVPSSDVVIDSEPHRSRTHAKQASCLLHWMSAFTLVVSLFVLHSNKTVNTITYKKQNCFVS